MNTFYDTEAMKAQIDRVYAEEQTGGRGSEVNLLFETIDAPKITRWQYPPSIRIIGEDDAEIVFKIQAVICGATLPPIDATQLPPTNIPLEKLLAKYRNLRQHVKLTAFGHTLFDAAKNRLADLQARIQQHVGTHVVLPFNYLPYEGSPSIDTHARYFTDRNLAPNEKNEAFSKLVDPHGVLTSIQPRSFIHGPDNVVEYCTRSTTDEGQSEFQHCSPSAFKPGDLVEVHFTIVGIPIKDNRYMVMLNLSAIVMIDDALRKASEAALNSVITGSTTLPVTPTKLKRKRLCNATHENHQMRREVREHRTRRAESQDSEDGLDSDKEATVDWAGAKLQRMELDK